MKQGKQEGWYRRKSYPHFDTPLCFEDAAKLVAGFESSQDHSFWPFLGFEDKKRRFKPDTPEKFSVKIRDIAYCSHRDGYIFSYYAKLLSDSYERFVRDTILEKCVIGYRPNLGTNVEFSKEVFDEIRKRQSCTAIALDLKDFFPSIPHDALKASMLRLLEFDRLPNDWFSIYRAMTKFSIVQTKDLALALGVKAKNFDRPICSASEFRKLRSSAKGFVTTNGKSCGIPQGSPMSAVMSNVAMLNFDLACATHFKATNTFYRRYSDDIVIVCDSDSESSVLRFIESELLKLGGALRIGADKTERTIFSAPSEGVLNCDTPFTYLGFTFDGRRVLLRGRTISRYYRRMTYAVRSAKGAAKKKKSAVVFKRKLLADFTHLGTRGFYRYARAAARTHNDEMPKRQLSRHFSVLFRKLYE